MKRLADQRSLDCSEPICRKFTDEERSLLTEWLDDGWMHYVIQP
jgi:50S ribosomal protein L16 3-hydroxylase